MHYGKALPPSGTSAFGCCFRENEKPDACLSVGVTSFVNLLSIFLIVSFLITHIKKNLKNESPFIVLHDAHSSSPEIRANSLVCHTVAFRF